ncbi:phytoene/squalene synthase family protein [Ramlibacter tataouinensis]|uniref:Candidate phytoene synthase n=1 Tax=Ramlibacter tataouinensis (strain ATCC BAA-407 / DSM 14655 / LMG 21543 / TTB310) TaxID=365046 RepID=F5XXP8_RAMTT|nr:phytoene/squalene synthase family protein [Ramlibacter tataouinensis]AEG91851.1 candidate phytoene synthase [Ramlibacter tataouinensis TTB310]
MSDAALLEHATRTIEAGSQSFAAATRLFDSYTRESAVLLYAWCRHCDDVVDGQSLGHGQREGDREGGAQRLARLQQQTLDACGGRPGPEPVFQGLAEVVRRHGIEPAWPMEHLAGFAMDVQGAHYRTLPDTLLYCWRVAGVVGVMMARVMGSGRPETLDRACDLGLAFQLTNIARDVVEDAAIGRLYLPEDWLREEGIDGLDGVLHGPNREALARVAARLVGAADPYYASAVAGIGELPMRCAWSIATARGIYREIGRKVRAQGGHAWDQRVATSRMEKLWLVARGAGVALIAHGVALPPRPPGLFVRPL